MNLLVPMRRKPMIIPLCCKVSVAKFNHSFVLYFEIFERILPLVHSCNWKAGSGIEAHLVGFADLQC
jgi:hypothetical protein